jgi:hypothetical protein
MYRFSGGRFGGTPPVTKNLIIINVVLLLGTMVLQQTGLNLNSSSGDVLFPVPFVRPLADRHPHVHAWRNWSYFLQHVCPLDLWENPGKRLGEQTLPDLLPGYWIGCGIFPSAGELHQFAPDIAALKAAYSVDRINNALLNEILQPGNQFYAIGRDLIRPTVGASGAVYGVLLAFGMLFPNTPLFLLFIPIPIKAKWLVIGFGVLELYLGITQSGGNIAHFRPPGWYDFWVLY